MKKIIINNFTIILNNNKNAKISRIDSFINNGYIFETKENSGISHLLEHIIIDGWKKCGNSCTNYWKKKGVEINASTGQSYVNYYISGLNKYFFEMLEYVISISLNPVITSNRMIKEKEAVYNELLINSTEKNIKLYDCLNKTLFNNEGLQYQDDINHQMKILKKFKLVELKKWAKKYYASGNMIFMISGNFNNNKTISFLKKNLNSFNNFSHVEHKLDIFKPGLIVKHIKNKEKKNTTVFFTFHSPISQKDDDLYLFHLFKKTINSDITSLLMKRLREEKKLIYNIQIENFTHGYGNYFIIEISTTNNNISKVIFNTIEVLKNISNGGFSNKYLSFIKEAFMVEYYNTCQNNNFLSLHIGEQYIHQIHNNHTPVIMSYKDILNKIKNVSRPYFINFIKKLLTFGNLKILYFGNKEIKNLRLEVQHTIL
jgi:predicted Zn-dependent peptidase